MWCVRSKTMAILASLTGKRNSFWCVKIVKVPHFCSNFRRERIDPKLQSKIWSSEEALFGSILSLDAFHWGVFVDAGLELFMENEVCYSNTFDFTMKRNEADLEPFFEGGSLWYDLLWNVEHQDCFKIHDERQKNPKNKSWTMYNFCPQDFFTFANCSSVLSSKLKTGRKEFEIEIIWRK